MTPITIDVSTLLYLMLGQGVLIGALTVLLCWNRDLRIKTEYLEDVIIGLEEEDGDDDDDLDRHEDRPLVPDSGEKWRESR